MKTKLITTVIAFALMIAFSSCNVINNQTHFRYLNKVPVNTPDQEITNTVVASNYQRSEDIANKKMNVHYPDSVSTNIDTDKEIVETSDLFPASQTQAKAQHNGIPKKVKSIIQLHPVYAQKGNLCSAKTSNENSSTDKNIFLYIVIALGIVSGASMVWGLQGAITALGIIGTALIIWMIFHSVFSSKKEQSITPNNNSAFIPEETTEPQKETTHTPRKKSTSHHAWVVLSIIAGLFLLIAFFGLAGIFLILVFAPIIAFIVGITLLIIWIEN